MTKQKIPSVGLKKETSSVIDNNFIVDKQELVTNTLVSKANTDTVNNLLMSSTEDNKIKYDIETVEKALNIYNNSYSDPTKVTYGLVNKLGKNEYDVLKQTQSQYSSTINTVDNAGVFYILDELTTNIKNANLNSIYTKAINVQPILKYKVLSFIVFGSKHKRQSINSQLAVYNSKLHKEAVGLDSVIKGLEVKLTAKKSELTTNLGVIRQGFTEQFQQIKLLSSQHLVARMALENQNKYIDHLSSLSTHDTDVQQALQEAKRIQNSLINRELILRNSIISVPLKAIEYNQMLSATQSIIEEIDNTLDSKFLSLYSSLNTIAIALKSAQGLAEQQSVEELTNVLGQMSNHSVTDVARRATTLNSENRLRETQALEEQFNNIKDFLDSIATLEQTNKANYEEANKNLVRIANQIQTEVIDKAMKDINSSKQLDF